MKIKFLKKSRIVIGFVAILIATVFTGCTNPNDINPPPADVGFVPEFTVPLIDFEDLLTLVQERTFKYFWDFAEPTSGLARESSSESQRNVITMGGSGFGIASFPVAVERGWITKEEAIGRMETVLTFLEKANKYHGAFSHWYEPSGNTRPFSEFDDGGDIVETALLMQGLLIARQYFSDTTLEETNIRNRITTLWEAVEWNWYVQGDSMIWHWSPNHGFKINLKVRGWNESLIVYVLAAASPTHPINNNLYVTGWTANGAIGSGGIYYGIPLPLEGDFGGPLFFAHYSFIGLDPRNLEDAFTNYFDQNKAHSLINYEHCVINPNDYDGYDENTWGITASTGPESYSAHSPTNDRGVIAPTAALSSFPYTPTESRKALENFYYNLNKELWGEYGFYDAFSIHFNWYSNIYLAIDQGPIILMIENHRTGQLWNLFMKDTDVINGLNKLGFAF